MSGGWQTTFNVPENATGSLTFKYRMTMSANYESNEYSEVLVDLDGSLVGVGANDYILHVAGDGNGGSVYDSGWQQVTIDLGSLTPGEHTITLGGYNNLKTYNDESTTIEFDEVSLTTDPGAPLATEVVAVNIDAIPLTITTGLTDTDGSESLSIIISGVPGDGSLSAGIDNGDGSWTLTPAELTGLTFNPPTDYSGTIDLTVTSTSTEAIGGAQVGEERHDLVGGQHPLVDDDLGAEAAEVEEIALLQ